MLLDAPKTISIYLDHEQVDVTVSLVWMGVTPNPRWHHEVAAGMGAECLDANGVERRNAVTRRELWRCAVDHGCAPFGHIISDASHARFHRDVVRRFGGYLCKCFREPTTGRLAPCGRAHTVSSSKKSASILLTAYKTVHTPGENMRVAYRRSDGGWAFHKALNPTNPANPGNQAGSSTADLQRNGTQSTMYSRPKEKKLRPGELTTRGYVESDVEGNPPPAYHYDESVYGDGTSNTHT